MIKYLSRAGASISRDRFVKRIQRPGYTAVARTEFPGGVLRTDWLGWDPDSPSDPHAAVETCVYWTGSEPKVELVARSLTAGGGLARHDAWLTDRALAGEL